jgi:hypothetical protein
MVTNLKPDSPDALLKIVEQVKEDYTEPPPQHQRGRPRTFSGCAFLLLLVLQGLVFPAPVPLFARWCPNSVGESTVLEAALAADQLPITDLLLGDSTFGGTALVATYAQHGGWLLTPQQVPANPASWKRDLSAYRRETIELLFQRLIQACDLKICPTKGLARTGTFVLASVWLYQVLFLDNHRHHKPLAHVKDIIDEARWRIAA